LCSALNPADVELLSDIAAWYEKNGHQADAEAAYRRALAIDRDAADLRTRLARLLLSRGDANGARREAEAALKVQPNRRVLVDIVEGGNRADSPASASRAPAAAE
jgi:Flp pilus assembly protein TadD